MSYQGIKINPKRFDSSQLKFYLILVPVSIFMLLPVVFIFNQAFKPMDELFRFPPTFIVERPTLRNFRVIWFLSSTTGVPMIRYLINTIVVTLATVLLTIFLTIISAYALSKKRFRAKNLMFSINQTALMFVPIAVMVPRYLVVVNLGLTNNFMAHILPMLAMPVGLFLVKQFIDQVPDSLLEAARIDGAGELVTITRIVMPLIRPAIATVGILSFQAIWNATESSNIYIVDETLKTFAFYLNTFAASNTPATAGISAAASLIMFTPNLVIFIALQSKVMNTMSHSGIK